jgi:hypothetical protein
MRKAQINQLGQKLGDALTSSGRLAAFRSPENVLLHWHDDLWRSCKGWADGSQYTRGGGQDLSLLWEVDYTVFRQVRYGRRAQPYYIPSQDVH